MGNKNHHSLQGISIAAWTLKAGKGREILKNDLLKNYN